MATNPTPVETGDVSAAPGDLELIRQFVNSAELDPDVEELTDLDALRRWLRRRRLIGAREELADGDLVRAIAIREALRELLEHRDSGPNAAAVRNLNDIPQGAVMRIAFDRDGQPRLRPAAAGLDAAFAELFAIIERASIEGTWQRLRVCADHGCRWAFYDNSKNRSRSWCNMAICGNRAKAREYRRRQRGLDQS
ncbi:MAG TPA: CGNR zinc finger domain-containing protein [Solirubrobacteraceae bacterium]|jgi:predicted RNA-binding Zn ribbon-like protein|nr:CGNR zinc finger domain-containing protein [Solirubrobacteraceae bacterium]